MWWRFGELVRSGTYARLSRGARIVIGGLMGFFGKEGRCFARRDLLLARIGVTHRVYYPALDELKEASIIRVNGLYRGKTVEYVFIYQPASEDDTANVSHSPTGPTSFTNGPTNEWKCERNEERERKFERPVGGENAAYGSSSSSSGEASPRRSLRAAALDDVRAIAREDHSQSREYDVPRLYNSKRALLKMMVGTDLKDTEQRALLMKVIRERGPEWLINFEAYTKRKDDYENPHRWVVAMLLDTNEADRTMARDWNEQEKDDADAERD